MLIDNKNVLSELTGDDDFMSRGDALKSNPGLVSLEAIQKRDGKALQTLVVGDGVKPLLNVK